MACRECYDLKNKYGRHNFVRAIKSELGSIKYLVYTTLSDSFGFILCKLINHRKLFYSEFDNYIFCTRCNKHIKIECNSLKYIAINKHLSYKEFNDMIFSTYYIVKNTLYCKNKELCIMKKISYEL